MTFLELLDRIGERRAARGRSPRDIRQLIGFFFLLGYYIMVWQFSQAELPEKNIDLVRDAMLTLGPPIGIIIGAMFRSDKVDEQRADNTRLGFEAIKEAAKAGSTTGGEPDANVIRPGDEVTIDKTPDPATTGRE